MRGELKIPLGLLLEGEPKEAINRLGTIIKNLKPKMLAVVGDYVTRNILSSEIQPKIVVVDHRIMRVNVEPFDYGERHVLRCKNRQGTIDTGVWEILEEAITIKSRSVVIVEGEEDLLVLPLVDLMPLESVIIYGQPREGMVLIEVTSDMKKWVDGFMARMEGE